jgi:hypothetical protein
MTGHPPYVWLLRGSFHSQKPEALSVAIKDAGLKANGEETTYILTSRPQNTGANCM